MTHTAIDAERLTVYCTETDHHEHKPLFEWLMNLALEREMAGVTAIRAVAGFGQHRRVHHAHLLAVSGDLPMVVQIIDEQAKLDAYLDAAGDALRGYTYIRERVRWHRPNTP